MILHPVFLRTRMLWVLFHLLVLIGWAPSLCAQPLEIRFETVPTRSLSVVPRAVAAADFNEDGNPDLAVVGGTEEVLVLLGMPDGSFDAPLSLVSSGIPWLIEAGDVDLDTHVDLIVANLEMNTLVVFLSDGLGGFVRQDPVVAPIGVDMLNLAMGDFDHDGILDVVTISAGEVIPFRGDGNGSFTELSPRSTIRNARSSVLTDIDGDSHLDIVISMLSGSSDGMALFVAQGDGTGFFSGFLPLGAPFNDDFRPGVVTSGDLDGNGHCDLVVARTPNNGHMTVMLGEGGGDFRTPAAYKSRGNFVELADIDNDGHLDALTSVIPGDPTLTIHHGTGFGSFETGPTYFSAGIGRTVIDDFNGDGSADVVASGRRNGNGRIYTLLGDGSGRLAAPSGLASLRARVLAAGDLNEDGQIDIVTGDSGLSVLLAEADGGWGAGTPPALITGAEDLILVDLDRDGHLDLVSAYRGDLRTALGDGMGGFSSTPTLFSLDGPLATGDLDDDGEIDIAGRMDDETVAVLFGDGSGGIRSQVFLAAMFSPNDLEIGDWDGDGVDDLAILRKQSGAPGATGGRYTIYRSDGAGGLTIVDQGTSTYRSQSVDAGDFTSDGILDLAVGSNGSDGALLVGLGDGTFERRSIPIRGTHLEGADLDGDGHLDLVTRSSAGKARIHRGDGSGEFLPDVAIVDWGVPAAGSWILVDLDGDGLPDLTHAGGGDFSTVMNTSLTASMIGGVNGAEGSPVDVLFVNGSAGISDLRTVRLLAQDPFKIEMLSPPSAQGGKASFVLYLWRNGLHLDLVRQLPFGLGLTCRPMVPSGPRPALDPVVIWNNIPGHSRLLGIPSRASQPAPGEVEHFEDGLGIDVEFVLQGIILDSASSQGKAAVTNAVHVISR